jgi:predicted DNA-binding ribbon-helix-helix protein
MMKMFVPPLYIIGKKSGFMLEKVYFCTLKSFGKMDRSAVKELIAWKLDKNKQ